MPFPPGQEQRWSKEFVHARATGSMWVTYSPWGCLWCLGSFILCQPVSPWGRGLRGSWRPQGLAGLRVRRKSRGSSAHRSAKSRPAPSQHPTLTIVSARLKKVFPPGEHISPLKTHVPPSSSLPLGKASPRHRVQRPRESGRKRLYGDHVVWPSRL